MNYIDDVATYINTLNLGVPVYAENFGKKESINQVVVMTETSSIDKNSPVMRVKFGVYCRNKSMTAARDQCNTIFGNLNNFFGKLVSSSTNVFQHISAVSPPYQFSNEANTPMYLVTFEAAVIERIIKIR